LLWGEACVDEQEGKLIGHDHAQLM
jgi:hypothetical protein